jgi:protein involved in polysaccharide export with SLBB domain
MMHRSRPLRQLALAACLEALYVCARLPAAAGVPPPNPPPVPVRTLQPGDEILILVTPGTTGAKRMAVQPDGTFYFPILGEVKVKGKTLTDLRDLLHQALAKELKQLDLGVGVLLPDDPQPVGRDPNSVMVLGAAPRPVLILLREKLTAWEAWSLALWTFDPDPNTDTERLTLIHANGSLERLMPAGTGQPRPSSRLLLPGDLLWIPPRKLSPAGAR